MRCTQIPPSQEQSRDDLAGKARAFSLGYAQARGLKMCGGWTGMDVVGFLTRWVDKMLHCY